MKTLDEVVKALEICANNQRCIDGCPYYKNDCPQYEMEKDALRYLKEYRDRKETLRNWTEKAISEQQNVADAYMLYKIASEKKQENLPLTWQELKQMEGKPVWLEFKDGRKFWTVILRADQIQDGSWMLIDHTDFYTKKDDVWQAYRKER